MAGEERFLAWVARRSRFLHRLWELEETILYGTLCAKYQGGRQMWIRIEETVQAHIEPGC